MAWHVYIIECDDGSLYTGITTNLNKRLAAHNEGRGAKYTKSRGPVQLRYIETANDRSHASQREYAIKALTKPAKTRLISDYITTNRSHSD